MTLLLRLRVDLSYYTPSHIHQPVSVTFSMGTALHSRHGHGRVMVRECELRTTPVDTVCDHRRLTQVSTRKGRASVSDLDMGRGAMPVCRTGTNCTRRSSTKSEWSRLTLERRAGAKTFKSMT